MPITPGAFSFSAERLYSIWQDLDNVQSLPESETHPLSSPYASNGLGSASRAKRLCLGLYHDVMTSELHCMRLDSRYGYIYSPRRPRRQVDDRDVFDRAIRILNQLPATSPSLYGALPFDQWPGSGFFKPCAEIIAESGSDMDETWEKLFAVNFVDTVVLRLILIIAQYEIFREQNNNRPDFHPPMVPIINATMLLLKTSVELATKHRGNKDEAGRWLVVSAFLWTSWQRLSTLFYRDLVLKQLEGFSLEIRDANSIRAGDILPEVFGFRRESLQRKVAKIPYLCPWAFSTLISDRALISTDLRRFIQVYRHCYESRPAACNPGPSQCSGLSSLSCRRFEQSEVTNQALHTSTCKGRCKRLFWDRDSFLSVSGPKAVDVSVDNSNSLHYCESTERTLTISHVWSHGQGGRPDRCGEEGTGFNSCLHERYAKIALSLGYQSYWMDTPCIPSERELRWECIANITKIFAMSGITLICDRDIMAIDVSSPTPDAYEQVLATLLICDWSMRAWTLLESDRGRYNLFLLCLGDKIVSLQEVLRTVCLRGSIDIALPFCMRPYLLPPAIWEHMSLFDNGESLFTDEDIEQSKVMTVAEAAVLLSCRHATRDNDVLLIWNILVGNREVYDPEEMWKKQIGKRIPTACLISSAPRLEGVQGFQWAPCCPNTSTRLTNLTTAVKEFSAQDGNDSREGLITEAGFLARWQAFRFPVDMRTLITSSGFADRQDDSASYSQQLQTLSEHYLRGFREGVLLRPLHARGPWKIPWPYRASSNHVLAVCGSQDGAGWIWRGVFEWHRTISLPPFDLADILLI